MSRFLGIIIASWFSVAPVTAAQDLPPAPDHLQEGESDGPGSYRVTLDLGLGLGGLASHAEVSTAMLLSGSAGLCLYEKWWILESYDAKAHPWRKATSLFNTVGPELRYRFWRGAFVGLGGGLAWDYLKKGEYQQSRLGGGWFLRAGYAHYFHPNIGLLGHASINQRYLAQLYTDFGVLAGPVFQF